MSTFCTVSHQSQKDTFKAILTHLNNSRWKILFFYHKQIVFLSRETRRMFPRNICAEPPCLKFKNNAALTQRGRYTTLKAILTTFMNAMNVHKTKNSTGTLAEAVLQWVDSECPRGICYKQKKERGPSTRRCTRRGRVLITDGTPSRFQPSHPLYYPAHDGHSQFSHQNDVALAGIARLPRSPSSFYLLSCTLRDRPYPIHFLIPVVDIGNPNPAFPFVHFCFTSRSF